VSLWGRWDGFGGSEPLQSLLPSLTGFVSCVQYAQVHRDLSRNVWSSNEVQRHGPVVLKTERVHVVILGTDVDRAIHHRG
jgi:hypothetical protein